VPPVSHCSGAAPTYEEKRDMPSCDPSALPAWYAVRTRHQHEKTVAHALSHKGFEVFLPLYAIRHHWKDRLKQLNLPLFPSYLFLRAATDQRVEILRVPGVYQFVGFAGMPCAIPEEEIIVVRRLLQAPQQVEPHPFLKAGDRVRVKCGPLAGIEGILVRQKNQCRLVLSIEMLTRSVAVEVELSKVEKLNHEDSFPSRRVDSNSFDSWCA
jgi:transcription antitermination factor NusG